MCRLLLGLDMDEVGVYCSWDMPDRPSIIPSTTFLGKGPSLPQGSWWCVLRVRSSCLSTERAGLPAGVPSFGAIGLLSHSWLDTPVVLLCQVTLQPSFLVFSSPSFPRVVPHLVCVLFPHPIYLPPSCSPPHSRFFGLSTRYSPFTLVFFVPSHLF